MLFGCEYDISLYLMMLLNSQKSKKIKEIVCLFPNDFINSIKESCEKSKINDNYRVVSPKIYQNDYCFSYYLDKYGLEISIKNEKDKKNRLYCISLNKTKNVEDTDYQYLGYFMEVNKQKLFLKITEITNYEFYNTKLGSYITERNKIRKANKIRYINHKKLIKEININK